MAKLQIDDRVLLAIGGGCLGFLVAGPVGAINGAAVAYGLGHAAGAGDLGSTNGTKIAGVYLQPHQPMRLKSDVTVKFGKLALTFAHLPESDASKPTGDRSSPV